MDISIQVGKIGEIVRQWGFAEASKPQARGPCYIMAKKMHELIPQELEMVSGWIVDAMQKGNNDVLHAWTHGVRDGIVVDPAQAYFGNNDERYIPSMVGQSFELPDEMRELYLGDADDKKGRKRTNTLYLKYWPIAIQPSTTSNESTILQVVSVPGHGLDSANMMKLSQNPPRDIQNAHDKFVLGRKEINGTRQLTQK